MASIEDAPEHDAEIRRGGSFLEVLLVFLRLGLTSFGGPVAHLGYFREELIARRKWVDDASYADIVALCQFLPGPASSQVGIALGLSRAGLRGGLAAWLGFTLPSAIAMVAFAYGVASWGDISEAGWLAGLKIVAVAVVALAVWGMAKSLTPDRTRASIAILAAIAVFAWPTGYGQVFVILIAGALSWRLMPREQLLPPKPLNLGISRRFATACAVLFVALLAGLPILRAVVENQALNIFDSFYRVGSLVFGGGHVVLPLLQGEVVPPGWVTTEEFVAGYGAAQAVPGPLFTFSAYLGAVLEGEPSGWLGASIALVAVFLPSFLLVYAALPLWDRLRAREDIQAATRGINAAVVGILVAALYDPVWTSAIHRPADFGLGLAAFGLLAFWKWPPWLVVILCAAGGVLIAEL
ncbi:MAG TPA: chromate transporter [Thermomicrobiales bacterium]|nr:chromate transporter [Thermomicrobiales bacterium]